MVYDLTIGKARDPLIAITVFIAIGIATTAVRLKSRSMRDVTLGIDDYLLLGALFSLLISVGIQFACVLAGGVGRHIEDVHPADVVKTLKLILPFEALYGITLCLIKTSVVMFYYRIFGSTPSFRISAIVAIGILIAWAISVVLETFLLCRPLTFNWNPTIEGGVCGDRNTVYVSAGALNVVTDFMVMALPIPHILKLQLHWRRKVGLVIMFSLGLFITIISAIRIKSLQIISFTDPTFTLPMGLFWTTLEPCLAIINANLPMVRTYLVAVAPKVFGSTADQTSRMKSSTLGGLGHGSAGVGGRSNRPDNFALIEDGRFGYRENDDVKLGKIGTESRIQVGGGRGRSKGDATDSDSERHLTKGGNQIYVGRSVDVESL
ncbi:hypothetical protein BKA64DRAFT_187790 [Cadophora sp. MPI-SDFR-AT-0126]|nr:hypothetical protein BKA64DRAFT_187790 [Leotiomycetes sp. MPI-SDFR-AT-0126]